jgi:hypothetical protein
MFDVHFGDVSDDRAKISRAQRASEVREPLVELGFDTLGFVEEYVDVPEGGEDLVVEEAGEEVGNHLLQHHVYEVLRHPDGHAVATVERHGETPRVFVQTLLRDGTIVMTRNPTAFGVDSSGDHDPAVGMIVTTLPGLDVPGIWEAHRGQVEAAVRDRKSEPVAHDEMLVYLAMLWRQTEVAEVKGMFVFRVGIGLFVTGLLMLGLGAIAACAGVFVDIGAIPAKTITLAAVPVLASAFLWQNRLGPRVARLRRRPRRRTADELLKLARDHV